MLIAMHAQDLCFCAASQSRRAQKTLDFIFVPPRKLSAKIRSARELLTDDRAPCHELLDAATGVSLVLVVVIVCAVHQLPEHAVLRDRRPVDIIAILSSMQPHVHVLVDTTRSCARSLNGRVCFRPDLALPSKWSRMIVSRNRLPPWRIMVILHEVGSGVSACASIQTPLSILGHEIEHFCIALITRKTSWKKC